MSWAIGTAFTCILMMESVLLKTDWVVAWSLIENCEEFSHSRVFSGCSEFNEQRIGRVGQIYPSWSQLSAFSFSFFLILFIVMFTFCCVRILHMLQMQYSTRRHLHQLQVSDFFFSYLYTLESSSQCYVKGCLMLLKNENYGKIWK